MDNQAEQKGAGGSPPPSSDEDSKRIHLMTKAGVIASGVWLALIGIYIVATWGKFWSMEPNELGDFLAGTFAPLAFLWLALGFFQQGVELRHSSRALYLQGEELRNSVEQQRALVDTTREQLDFERQMLKHQQEEIARASAPIIDVMVRSISHQANGFVNVTLMFTNHGATCTNVKVSYDKRDESSRWPSLPRGEKVSTGVLVEDTLLGHVTYLDERGLPGRQVFHLKREENGSVTVSKMVESQLQVP